MEIKLAYKTPHYLKTIWTAGRTCYSQLSPIELLEKEPAEAEMLRLADRIINSKHLSVLEHCAMTFAVKNVSRTLLAQYSRHRIGVSLSVQSQRWVSERSAKNDGIFDYVIPGEIVSDEEARRIYIEAMEFAQRAYDQLEKLGIKNEDARFVLPGGAATNFMTSLNLRSLFDLYEKRVRVPGAQWEIREMISRMGELIVAEEPWLEPYLSKRLATVEK